MSKHGCTCKNYANGRCLGEGDCELAEMGNKFRAFLTGISDDNPDKLMASDVEVIKMAGQLFAKVIKSQIVFRKDSKSAKEVRAELSRITKTYSDFGKRRRESNKKDHPAHMYWTGYVFAMGIIESHLMPEAQPESNDKGTEGRKGGGDDGRDGRDGQDGQDGHDGRGKRK